MMDYYYESKIKEAWKLFINKGMLRREVLRPEISLSWARCQLFGLQALSLKESFVSLEEYHSAQNDSRNLIQNATSHIENFISICGYSNINIALSDKNGIVLVDWIQNDSGFLYRKGLSSLEEKMGTNGIALSLFQKKPCIVRGAEHYCETLQTFQSFGVPLYDQENVLLGVIGAMTSMENDGELLLEKMEHLGALIVGAIQKNNSHQVVAELKNHYVAILDAVPEAILCFDKYGQILYCNEIARKMFAYKMNDLKKFNITELIKMDHPIYLESLINGEPEGCIYEGYYEDISGYIPSVLETVSFPESRASKMGMIKLKPLKTFRNQLNQWIGHKANFEIKDIIGMTKTIQELRNKIREIARTEFPCLIIGERGSGKKVVAQAIHSESQRLKHAFYTIHCGATSKKELEYTLFGSVGDGVNKETSKIGSFELFDEGTIYIDNVAELPLHVQGKLLKYIDTKTFKKCGSEIERKADVRIICGCLQDPVSLIRKGLIREELYNRLNCNKIETIPLRKRKEDIPMLADYLLEEMLDFKKGEYQRPQQGFYNKLISYDWPGNVKELQKVLYGICYHLKEGDKIDEGILKEDEFEQIEKKDDQKSLNLAQIEKETILKAIEISGENLSQASKLLGIGRSTLYRKIESYRIVLNQNETQM